MLFVCAGLLTAEIDALRADHERQQKHYEALLRSKSYAAASAPLSAGASVALAQDKKSVAKKQVPGAAAAVQVGAASRVLPSQLVSTEERDREAEILRLREQLRV